MAFVADVSDALEKENVVTVLLQSRNTGRLSINVPEPVPFRVESGNCSTVITAVPVILEIIPPASSTLTNAYINIPATEVFAGNCTELFPGNVEMGSCGMPFIL